MSERSLQKPIFPNPMEHPEWITPHSREWYLQIDNEYGEYKYPWKSQFDEPTAEMIFAQKISSYLKNDSRVLDVGCGHGEFTYHFAAQAKEVVGIDIRESFIATANKNKSSERLHFLTVDVDDGLPFPDDSFDVVYTKKGPWLFQGAKNGEGNRVIKPGGIALLFLHSGTDGGLRELFPGLYSPLTYNIYDLTPLVNDLKLQENHLNLIEIQMIEESEYLATPEDVLMKKCFGQNRKLKEFVWQNCLRGVEEIFHKNATSKGLKVTNYYRIVTARMSF